MSTLPKGVIRHRSRSCAACKTPCGADIADPCARCPLPTPLWGQFDCGADAALAGSPQAALVQVSHAAPASALWRTLKRWRRAGIRLVNRARRREIAPICTGCDYVTKDPRTGLMGCGAGCNCGVAAVCVYRVEARCSLGKWPLI